MKLTRDGIKDRAAWEQAGIALPGYDVAVSYTHLTLPTIA